jgi:GNAT superfamily N-acetyltransferase
MSLVIRQWTQEDYPVLLEIRNACMPDYAISLNEYRRGDEVRDAKCYHNRLVAERYGATIGFASFGHTESMYNPQRFEFQVQVLPQHRRQGIGSALYNAMNTDLERLEPDALRTYTREDMPADIRFIEKRGYVEEQRYWESRLNVASFDTAPFAGAQTRPAEDGVTLTTYGALADDPERDRKMYELETELFRDLPSPEPLTDLTYEQYRKHVLESPNLLPDGWIVAVHGGEYIGVSGVWHAQDKPYLDTGLTAVKREWRRHGIALAMKLRVIDYARREGYAEIRTDNESNNRGMLSINERLGFVKQPVWIGYVKKG